MEERISKISEILERFYDDILPMTEAVKKILELSLPPKEEPSKTAEDKTFWSETSRLMDEYRKEGNEQRVQGIVDCRILYNRFASEANKEIENLTKQVTNYHNDYWKLNTDFSVMEKQLSQFKQVPSEKRVTDEEIRDQIIKQGSWEAEGDCMDIAKWMRDKMSLPSEGKEIETCDYCKRTEPCRGSYPEGCFHPKA